jgi:hypothetical protein
MSTWSITTEGRDIHVKPRPAVLRWLVTMRPYDGRTLEYRHTDSDQVEGLRPPASWIRSAGRSSPRAASATRSGSPPRAA